MGASMLGYQNQPKHKRAHVSPTQKRNFEPEIAFLDRGRGTGLRTRLWQLGEGGVRVLGVWRTFHMVTDSA